MAIRRRDRHRLKKILVIGIIIGAAAGILFTMIVAGNSKRKTAADYETQLAELEEENSSLTSQLEEATAEEPSAAEQLASEDDSWMLTLIDTEHTLDSSYTPELSSLDDSHSVDSRILEAAQQMIAAGEAEGLSFNITSAYRSYDDQRSVFNTTMQSWIASGYTPLDAYDETKLSVQIPGSSEQASGLALDITSSEYAELDDEQASTEEAQWLAANCATYGFILRYPSDKTDITGIVYEPWHYRYVGTEAAAEIMSQGITLEEYLGVASSTTDTTTDTSTDSTEDTTDSTSDTDETSAS